MTSSSIWTEEMLRAQAINDGKFRGMESGCLWRIIVVRKAVYAAIGDGGNVICVNEDKSIAMALTSYFNPAVSDRSDFIQEKVEPFVLNG